MLFQTIDKNLHYEETSSLYDSSTVQNNVHPPFLSVTIACLLVSDEYLYYILKQEKHVNTTNDGTNVYGGRLTQCLLLLKRL